MDAARGATERACQAWDPEEHGLQHEERLAPNKTPPLLGCARLCLARCHIGTERGGGHVKKEHGGERNCKKKSGMESTPSVEASPEEAFYWKESLTPNPPSFVLAAAASLPLTAASHGRLAAASHGRLRTIILRHIIQT